MTRYGDFRKLEELMKLKKTKRGYSKFIQTGSLDIFDYDSGFFDVQILSCRQYPNGRYFVRIWFGTADDSDVGGWKEVESKEESEDLVDKISNNIFKNMIALPNKKELNAILQQYGIAVDCE